MATADTPGLRPPTRARDSWRAALGLLAIATVAILLFMPALEAPLAFDDVAQIERIAEFTGWFDAFGVDCFFFFRPVKNLFFLAVERAGGLAAVYHAATLAIYLVAMVGVYELARQLSGRLAVGLLTAGLWVVGAPNATVASWASCFNISVAAAALGFGLAAYDRWREDPRRRLSAAAFFAALAIGLLAYETAVAMAPLAVAIDLFRGRRVLSRDALARYAVIAALVLAWMTWRHIAGAKSGEITLGNPSFSADITPARLSASAPYFLWTHFVMWAAPWGNLECLGSYLWNRSIPAVILPFCWLLLLGCVLLAFRFRKPGNLFLFGLAWFLIAAFPSGNFLPIGNTPYADYYVVLPSIGLCLAVAEALRILFTSATAAGIARPLRIAAWTCIALLIGWRGATVTATRCWVLAWTSPAEVMARTAAARPYQFLAKAFLSKILVSNGELETARWYAERAIEDEPTLAMPHTILGEIAYQQNREEQALACFRRAIPGRHLDSRTLQHAQLRIAQMLADEPAHAEEAWFYLLPVLKHRDSERHPEAVLTAAGLLRTAKRHDDEIAALRKGLGYHPDNAEIRVALIEAEKRRQQSADHS